MPARMTVCMVTAAAGGLIFHIYCGKVFDVSRYPRRNSIATVPSLSDRNSPQSKRRGYTVRRATCGQFGYGLARTRKSGRPHVSIGVVWSRRMNFVWSRQMVNSKRRGLTAPQSFHVQRPVFPISLSLPPPSIALFLPTSASHCFRLFLSCCTMLLSLSLFLSHSPLSTA